MLAGRPRISIMTRSDTNTSTHTRARARFVDPTSALFICLSGCVDTDILFVYLFNRQLCGITYVFDTSQFWLSTCAHKLCGRNELWKSNLLSEGSNHVFYHFTWRKICHKEQTRIMWTRLQLNNCTPVNIEINGTAYGSLKAKS